MAVLFLLLTLIALLAILVGLVQPRWVLSWSVKQTRAWAFAFYLFTALISIMLMIAFLPENEPPGFFFIAFFVVLALLYLGMIATLRPSLTKMSPPSSPTVPRSPTTSSRPAKAQPFTTRDLELRLKLEPVPESSMRISSLSDPTKSYRCNLSTLTCSCPDFQERRRKMPLSSPRRLCKHLVHAMADQPDKLPNSFADYWQDIAACARHEYGFPFHPGAKVVETSQTLVEIRPQEDNDEWLNIFAEGERYGFKPSIGAWSYGKKPTEHEKIERAIYGNEEDLPTGTIMTVKRTPHEKGLILVQGEVDEVELSLVINPRARWQTIHVDGDELSYNTRDDLYRFPPKWRHLQPAARQWILDEFTRAKQLSARVDEKEQYTEDPEQDDEATPQP
ncbi:hypothetical protein V6C53_04990 [Desulfocurvibacter africanus]|uniref:hypothetical protein n=1 Tax=Desulfocurvibacter africanus TaxID=873 RepID=UPI002FDA20E5